MDWNLVLLMVGIHALMFLTPGPDSIVVVSRATAQGFSHAMAATFGIISGGLIFVPAIAFGLDFINSLSPAIWLYIRAAGAIYLIYVGYNMLSFTFKELAQNDNEASETFHKNSEPLFSAYFQGFITNLGNPKMVVLLTSFLPQFVAVELGNVSFQILVLGFLMYLNGLVCFFVIILVAILVKEQIVKRFGSRKLSFLGSSVAGSTMLGVGAWMLWAPLQYFVVSRSR